MVEENNTQWSNIHGGGAKIGRIHFTIVDLHRARRNSNWKEVYYCLEELYTEIEAYMKPKEREEIVPVWESLNNIMVTYNKGQKINNLFGETLLLEIKIRRVVARLNLDMGTNREQHTYGGMDNY